MEMYDEAMFAYENGKFFSVTLYDQSSAFDLVDYSILRERLQSLGFDRHAQKWFMNYKSYLEDPVPF